MRPRDRKAACSAKSEAWTERSRLREEEIAGVAEASVLNTNTDAYTNTDTNTSQYFKRNSQVSVVSGL